MVDAAARGDASIVAEDMDLAEGRERRLCGALDMIGIGDIAGDAAHMIAVLVQIFQRLIQRALLDIGEHHVHALVRIGLRHR